LLIFSGNRINMSLRYIERTRVQGEELEGGTAVSGELFVTVIETRPIFPDGSPSVKKIRPADSLLTSRPASRFFRFSRLFAIPNIVQYDVPMIVLRGRAVVRLKREITGAGR
jgi:hypothetical protein